MHAPCVLGVQLVSVGSEAVDDVDVRFRVATRLATLAAGVAAKKVLKRSKAASRSKRKYPLRLFRIEIGVDVLDGEQSACLERMVAALQGER